MIPNGARLNSGVNESDLSAEPDFKVDATLHCVQRVNSQTCLNGAGHNAYFSNPLWNDDGLKYHVTNKDLKTPFDDTKENGEQHWEDWVDFDYNDAVITINYDHSCPL
jgi:hypothetical protein